MGSADRYSTSRAQHFAIVQKGMRYHMAAYRALDRDILTQYCFPGLSVGTLFENSLCELALISHAEETLRKLLASSLGTLFVNSLRERFWGHLRLLCVGAFFQNPSKTLYWKAIFENSLFDFLFDNYC